MSSEEAAEVSRPAGSGQKSVESRDSEAADRSASGGQRGSKQRSVKQQAEAS